ncbi:UDP-4-amino-4,6-dideoxy-N-acetyl-beta-L-altrosamine transaminase [bacterium]|nr:UDP-4-amino-4,6-dideoxy-N-acetyl-beta-L-altrosamine transaminase [bacterium]
MSDTIPYGRQLISDEDIDEVVRVLRSDWLTTGPQVEKFEEKFSQITGAKYAVAVSSGTAALHVITAAIGIQPGDEVIVPTMTFAATANSVVYQGATPVFADVLPETLLIDPASVRKKITKKTKALYAVDYAGQPCNYQELRRIANEHGLILMDDACHSLGSEYQGLRAGQFADLNAFSFHPVKHITTGEGGMVTTDNPDFAKRMKTFRNHGITTNHRERELQGAWFYEMVDLGFNYRLTDIQCALGIRQLDKLSDWVKKRKQIAHAYDEVFQKSDWIKPLGIQEGSKNSYHLYVVRVQSGQRDALHKYLRAHGIGANVHYIPVHLHPYYKKNFATQFGQCPVAEKAYGEILSLPIFPTMTDAQLAKVIQTIHQFRERAS